MKSPISCDSYTIKKLNNVILYLGHDNLNMATMHCFGNQKNNLNILKKTLKIEDFYKKNATIYALKEYYVIAEIGSQSIAHSFKY